MRQSGIMDRIVAALELSLAPTTAAPGMARAAVSDWLDDDGSLDELTCDTARLLVSEVVTNCVQHARIQGRHALRLRGSMREATMRLEIWDAGTDGAVASRTPRFRDDNANAGGFGLYLVAMLASDWGVDRDAHGTTVWLELQAAAEPTA